MEPIVKVICKCIQDRGLKIVAISQKINVSSDILSKTLQGKRKMKADELILLCEVLGLTLDDFKKNQNLNTSNQSA